MSVVCFNVHRRFELIICVGDVVSQIKRCEDVEMVNGDFDVFRDVIGDASTEGCRDPGKSLCVGNDEHHSSDEKFTTTHLEDRVPNL